MTAGLIGAGDKGRSVGVERTHSKRMPSRTTGRWLKSALEIVGAAILLVLALPLALLIVLCIQVESPGPVFYRAERIGRHGRPLRMLKFRKMRPGARGLALTVAADPRLTRVGAVLAATKLDELPQLLHVLRGEMSLIGPRPEDPDFVARYPGEFAEILHVRPGMTGLSQLAFATESGVLSEPDPVAGYVASILPQKLALDRLYVTRWSLLMDLRILLWTFVAVVLRQPVAVNRATGRLRLRLRPAVRQPEPVHVEPAAGAPAGQEAV